MTIGFTFDVALKRAFLIQPRRKAALE